MRMLTKAAVGMVLMGAIALASARETTTHRDGGGGIRPRTKVNGDQSRQTVIDSRSANEARRALSVAAADRPGMRITFQSCGYEAAFLSVSCTNGNTGASNAQPLGVFDTSAASCAQKLTMACNAVGYEAQQDGDSVAVFGTGIRVTAVGPVFTKEDF
jgi:hypothetical protein